MKKIFSFLIVFILISCSKDVEEPVLFTLTATANPTEGGTVSPTNGQYESGNVATVTATPNAEYVFEKWTGGATGTSSSVSVTMNGNKSVVANFIKKQYPLTIEIEGEGTVTETVIKQGLATDYNSGTIVELTAEPTVDWEFVEWTGDITSTENPTQITIDGPKTVKSIFKLKNYQTNFIDYPSFFLTDVDYFIDDKNLNLSQYKQPLWVTRRMVHFPYEIQDNEWVGPTGFLIDDFNNDGYNDIFFSFLTGGENSPIPFKLLLYEDQSKTLVDKSSMINNNTGQTFSRRISSADFNSDGIKDFVSASHPELPDKELSHLDIIISNSNGWEQKTLSIQSRNTDVYSEQGYYHGVDVGDVDNDGDIDIVVAMWHNDDKGISLWRNDGSGNFEEKNNIVKLSNSYDKSKENSSFVVDLIDYNSDQCLDLVYSWNPSLIKTGNCDGTFGPDFLEFEVGGHGGVLAYDLDDDNDNELIFRKEVNGSVSVAIFENDGSNQFNLVHDIPAKGIGEPLDLKDLNGDGKLDIIGRFTFGDGVLPEDLINSNVQSDHDYSTVLINDGINNFNSYQYPFVSEPQSLKFNNNSRELEWLTAFQIKNTRNDPTGLPHLIDTRGEIKTWFIYRSDSPFYFTDSNVEVIEISDDEINKEKIYNNVFKYSIQLKENIRGFYRIGHLDSNNIKSSLSYEIEIVDE